MPEEDDDQSERISCRACPEAMRASEAATAVGEAVQREQEQEKPQVLRSSARSARVSKRLISVFLLGKNSGLMIKYIQVMVISSPLLIEVDATVVCTKVFSSEWYIALSMVSIYLSG